MLAKLIKHDFKALSRILLPTQLAVFGATIIGSLCVNFNLRSGYTSISGSAGLQLLRIVTGFLTFIMVMGIIAAGILTLVIIVHRFYTNFMGDEGYLTFTLPVTTTQLLWAKLISAFLWTTISAAVIFVCVNLFMMFGLASKGFINADYFDFMGTAFRYFTRNFNGSVLILILEALSLIIVGTAFNIIEIYLALVLGGTVTKKHKLLAGIGFYFAINFVLGVLFSVGQFIFMGNIMYKMDSMESFGVTVNSFAELMRQFTGLLQPMYWFYFITMLAASAGAFLLCRYMMKNKLNLE